jgi:streptogramin lyase
VHLAEVRTARLNVDSPDWLTAAAGSLWVKLDGGDVLRVEPHTATVRQRIGARGPDEFTLCQGFGRSTDSVWSCTPFGSLERIEAATGRVTALLPSPMRSDEGQVVQAADRLWFVTHAGDEIAGLDPRDNTVGPPLPLGAACTELAADGTTVWAACPGTDEVLRVDVAVGAVTGRLVLDDPRLVAARGQVWVGYSGGVAQVDPDTLEVTAVYDVVPGLGGGLWAGRRRVWVRCDGGPFLVGIDARKRQVTTVVQAHGLPSGGSVLELDGQVWASAYDDGTVVRLNL